MAFLPPWREHVKGFLSKWTVLKVDLLQDIQIYSLEGCMCARFSPEIVQAVAVKGLRGGGGGKPEYPRKAES